MKNNCFLAICLFALVCLTSGCSNDEAAGNYTLSGRVTTVGSNSVGGVSVILQGKSLSGTTNADGYYRFDNLDAGKYTVNFSKAGFDNLTKETVLRGRNTTLDAEMVISNYTPGGGSGGGTASVSVTDYLAVSDGIYLYFNPSSNTAKYYWGRYKSADLTGVSDATIIADLLQNGVNMNMTETQEGYSWGLSPSTNYVFCIVAYDSSNKAGSLVKKTITTKSATNQPLAMVSVTSISGGKAYYNVTRNTYCSSFFCTLWYNVSESDINEPDIYWAYYLYEEKKSGTSAYTSNQTNYSYTPSVQGLCAIVTLGYTSSGISGLVSKKFFDTSTGALRAAAVAKEQPIMKCKQTKPKKNNQ